MASRPLHKLEDSEKDANWIKLVMDYYTQQANYLSGESSKLQILYDAAEGILDESTYKYVLNPFNTENDKLKRFPAQLRNYDIIGPVLKIFLGEQGRKGTSPTVIVTSGDVDNVKKQEKHDHMAKFIAQDFINNLNGMGLETGVPSIELQGYDAINKKFDLNYDDFRAKIGQQALDYIRYDQDLDEKEIQMLYDWLVVGRAFTYKDVYRDDVEYEVVDPRDVRIIGWGKTEYAEDADAAVRAKDLSPSHVLDKFQDEINEHKDKEDIVAYLDEHASDEVLTNDIINLDNENISRRTSSSTNQQDYYDDAKIRIYHVTFKTLKHVADLTYMDETTGSSNVMPVDGNYKLDKASGDISIERYWINEVWEAYQIEDKWILGGGPIPVQRQKINNLSECKLPYNGRIRGYRNSEIVSTVKSGLVYQVLYNIFMYRFELTMARSKDKILMMPQGLIPDGPEWDADKWMYHLHSTGIGFYDEMAERAATAIQGMKQLDLGMGQHLSSMWEFTEGVRNKWHEEVGMNRQRYGSSYASDGKGNTEQAIFRSAMITADMFRQLDKLFETDQQGLVDYSKVAYLGGKKSMFITSQGRKAWLEMNEFEALQYLETDFGIFVKNSTDELDKLEQVKGLLQPMAQNGLGPDALIDILDSNNVSAVKEIAKKSLREQREYEQQTQKTQQEGLQQMQQAELQDKQAERDTKLQIAQISADAKIEAAMIAADADLVKLYNDTVSMSEEQEATEEQGLSNQASGAADRIKNRKAANDEAKHHESSNIKREDQRIKREQMASKERIAKENKNKYDK